MSKWFHECYSGFRAIFFPVEHLWDVVEQDNYSINAQLTNLQLHNNVMQSYQHGLE